MEATIISLEKFMNELSGRGMSVRKFANDVYRITDKSFENEKVWQELTKEAQGKRFGVKQVFDVEFGWRFEAMLIGLPGDNFNSYF
jgi:hypothetical protein